MQSRPVKWWAIVVSPEKVFRGGLNVNEFRALGYDEGTGGGRGVEIDLAPIGCKPSSELMNVVASMMALQEKPQVDNHRWHYGHTTPMKPAPLISFTWCCTPP